VVLPSSPPPNVNRVTFWAANEQLSDPPVLVPRQAAETFLAGLVVNQVDDECPHDRTSLLIKGGDRGSMFQDVFVSGCLRRGPKRFRLEGRIVSSASEGKDER
jgi:hypothetical protein